MTAELQSHPSSTQLHSFAQGRLSAAEMAEVERHVVTCDSCCLALESVPEDTLVHLAREAATEAFRAGETARVVVAAGKNAVPAELTEHSRYKILGLVGQGGMGAVYKAEHRLMERLVALKVISRSFTANPQAVERFRREVKAAAKLSHANIVTAHDAEQAGDLHFLVMEFVEGVSLDRLVAKQGVPTVPQACGLIRQAALGLQHAHEKGMVHRDIKPANLMVTRRGQIKILDFGLARLAREMTASETEALSTFATEPGNATSAGMILGTPDYIAPEQAADSRQADIRADIYSLGCTFYFLLTGQPPFPKGTVMQKLAWHMHTAPASIAQKRPDVPAEVAAIVERMMAKDPADRYQTPGEVAKELAAVQKGTAGSLPKLEELKPPEDLFAGIDLASVPAAPSVAVIQRPAAAAPGDGGDISDWLVQNRRLVTMIGAIAGGVLLVGLCVWGAGKLAGGKPVAGVSKNGGSTAALVPAKSGVEANSASLPDAKKSIPVKVSSPGQAAAAGQKKILFCLPHTGLYYPDYDNVMRGLPATVTVVIASTEPGRCQTTDVSKVGPEAEYVIGNAIDVDEYDAIIFSGKETYEFTEGPQGAATKALITQFRQKENKVVGAICAGQNVLAYHGLFAKNVRVAKSEFLEQRFEGCGARWEYTQPVVKDGKIITAQREANGGSFARRIATEIGAK